MTFGAFNFPRPPPDRSDRSRSGASWTFATEVVDFPSHELERLAHACLQGLDAALAQVAHWRQAGHGLEDIYLRAITPCARLLGQWWLCDQADFAQITIASTNLQRVLHHHSHEFCAPGADRPAGLHLLLVTEPQSQHTMGAFMLGEFFRRRGWGVQLLSPHDAEDVLSHLRRDWFDAVGLSISTGRQMQALAALVPRLRSESPNAHLCVLAGGPAALADPQALQALGVDLVGEDAQETVQLLSALVVDRKN